MHTPNDDDIRARAYALWEQDGSPEGRDIDYWHRAERELSEEAGVDTSAETVKVAKPPLLAGLPIH